MSTVRVVPKHYKRGEGNAWEYRSCEVCGDKFKAYFCHDNKSGNNGRFCSMKCHKEYARGENAPSWIGGRHYTSSGYVMARAPEGHPYANKRGYASEHRLIMEAHIGRYLEPHEVVHHKNHIRDDNRIENLGLFASHSEHRRHHAPKIKFDCGWCGDPVYRTQEYVNRTKAGKVFCSPECCARWSVRQMNQRLGRKHD